MLENISFRPAVCDDVPRIWEMMLQAKSQMKRLGSSQWDDGYPLVDNIVSDINSGNGYVMVAGETAVAYAVVDFNSEPAYSEIEGRWKSADNNYVVMHRLAVSDDFKHQGCATAFFRFAEGLGRENGCSSFRIDTNFDNSYMLAIFSKLGFEYCGKVRYIRGERLAYEKVFK